MNMFKKTGGFTLVELIVVIAILAILAGVAVPAYSGYITKANEAADYTMLDSVKTAIVFAAIENDPGHDCTVTGATISGTSLTNIAVTGTKMGENGTDSTMTVDITGLIESITYKTAGVTGATWDGTEWKLTKSS